jgi:formylglycine-generating enzyme required for sulfatase activity
MKTWKQSTFFGLVAFIVFIFGFVACDDGDGEKKSEQTGDKNLTGIITISPTTAVTGEELTATYSGSETVNYQWNKDGTAIGGKTDQKFTPIEAGSYTVTVSLAGYISKTSTAVEVTGKQMPVVDDFTISGTGTFDHDGTEKIVNISPKPNKSMGEITIYYNGSVTAPVAINTYTVTFDVAETEIFKPATGLSAGTLVIESPIKMVQIQGGTFTMGSPEDEPNRSEDETQHSVTLTGFSMGKYPVTQEQYLAVMGTNPSNYRNPSATKHPVEKVTWYDALVFCNKLSVFEGLSPAYRISGSTDPATWGTGPITSNATWNAVEIVADSAGYRMPTEAQWEYACRAGTTTAYNTGATISDDTGWYKDNSDNRTHSVGEKPANAWDLYDMHGNVFEWCWDWYGTYADGAQTNPTGAVSGDKRVARGGSYYGDGEDMRSAFRDNYTPSTSLIDIGFRLVRPAQ